MGGKKKPPGKAPPPNPNPHEEGEDTTTAAMRQQLEAQEARLVARQEEQAARLAARQEEQAARLAAQQEEQTARLVARQERQDHEHNAKFDHIVRMMQQFQANLTAVANQAASSTAPSAAATSTPPAASPPAPSAAPTPGPSTAPATAPPVVTPAVAQMASPAAATVHRSKRMETPKLDGPDSTSLGEYRSWKKQFIGYTQVERLYDECSLIARRTILIGALGTGWQRLIDAGTLRVIDSDDVEEIIDKVGEHLRQHRNPLVDRIQFSHRDQSGNEQVDDYHAALCILEENSSHVRDITCDACRITKEERLRDRIITGLADKTIQAAVLEVPIAELTLEKTLNICRAKEASSNTQSGMKIIGINKVGRQRKDWSSDMNRSEDTDGSYKNKSQGRRDHCAKCAGPKNHSEEECWANDKHCHCCGKLGHVSPVCPSKQKPHVRNLSVFCGNVIVNEAICELKTITMDAWNDAGKYKGKLHDVLPDTGAGANLIGIEQAKRLGNMSPRKNEQVPTAANGLAIEVEGTITATLKYGPIKKEVVFLVTNEYKGALLNRQECENFKLIPQGFTDKPAQLATTVELPGKDNAFPDDVSRTPSQTNNENVTMYEQEPQRYSGTVACVASVTTERDPIMPTIIFQEIATYFFEMDGHHYMAMVDRLSGYPVLAAFHKAPTAEMAIERLLDLFATFGCPQRIFSDDGTQVRAASMQKFLKRWQVDSILSTPEGNDQAEATVQLLKQLIQKNGNSTEKLKETLLELRNMPREGDKSPAETVFGHSMKSGVSAHWNAFSPEWLRLINEHDARAAELAAKRIAHYKSACARTPIRLGVEVLLQDQKSGHWDKTGVVIGKGTSGDFKIKSASGLLTWRNRRFLKVLKQRQNMKRPEEGEEEVTLAHAKRSMRAIHSVFVQSVKSRP